MLGFALFGLCQTPCSPLGVPCSSPLFWSCCSFISYLNPLFPLGLSPKAVSPLHPSYFRRPLLGVGISRVCAQASLLLNGNSSLEFPFLSWKNITWPEIPKYACLSLPPIAGGSFRTPPQANWTLNPCIILWCHHVVDSGSATEFSTIKICSIFILYAAYVFWERNTDERKVRMRERCEALRTGERRSLRLAFSLKRKTSQHPA